MMEAKKYFALPFRPYHVLFENFKEKQGVVNWYTLVWSMFDACGLQLQGETRRRVLIHISVKYVWCLWAFVSEIVRCFVYFFIMWISEQTRYIGWHKKKLYHQNLNNYCSFLSIHAIFWLIIVQLWFKTSPKFKVFTTTNIF